MTRKRKGSNVLGRIPTPKLKAPSLPKPDAVVKAVSQAAGQVADGSHRVGFGQARRLSFGVGMWPSTLLSLRLRVIATPPATPSSAAPPASAGTLAFSAIVPMVVGAFVPCPPDFDDVVHRVDLLCVDLRERD